MDWSHATGTGPDASTPLTQIERDTIDDLRNQQVTLRAQTNEIEDAIMAIRYPGRKR